MAPTLKTWNLLLILTARPQAEIETKQKSGKMLGSRYIWPFTLTC